MNMMENSCVSPEAIIWGEQETVALINLYELEPCLYDRKDPNYSNHIERNNAYYRIKQVMVYLLPTCTVQQIRNKIRNLSMQFITEKLAKECSIHNGLSTEDTYKPSLWCFEHLQFLDEHLQILPKNVKCKKSKGEKKKSGSNKQFDLSADSEANHLNIEDDRGELSREAEENNCNHDSLNKDCLNETSSVMNQTGLNGMSDKISFPNVETSSDMDKNNLSDMSNKDDLGETNDDVDKNSFINRNYKDDLIKTSSVMNQTGLNVMSDKISFLNVNNKRKRKVECLVSSSKKVSSEMLDKEDIFGLYVADEMQTLRKNSLLYLRTKQNILKILTDANFKLANVEL